MRLFEHFKNDFIRRRTRVWALAPKPESVDASFRFFPWQYGTRIWFVFSENLSGNGHAQKPYLKLFKEIKQYGLDSKQLRNRFWKFDHEQIFLPHRKNWEFSHEMKTKDFRIHCCRKHFTAFVLAFEVRSSILFHGALIATIFAQFRRII